MKKLIKQLLKEEFKVSSIFVAMFERDNVEYVIDFKDSYENDNDEYGRFYVVTYRLDSFNNNPDGLIKISNNTENNIGRYHLLNMEWYEQEYGGRNQEDMITDYQSGEYEEWVDYSGFNIEENREGIYAINNMYIVEFHTTIIRSDNTHDTMSQLTND